MHDVIGLAHESANELSQEESLDLVRRRFGGHPILDDSELDLAAVYAAVNGKPRSPAVEATWTMHPCFRSMRRRRPRIRRKGTFACSVNASSMTRSVVSCNWAEGAVPALFTRMSGRPQRSAVVSRICSVAPSSSRSVDRVSTSVPSVRSSSATVASRTESLAVRASRIPRLEKARAMHMPIPRLAPVIRAI